MSLFSIRHLCFSRNTQPILKDISFSLQKAEVLSILGPNGVGKTTLMKCILGLLKFQSGEGLLYDKPLGLFGKEIWKYISYVPQAKHNILNIKVLDMVALGLNPKIVFKPNAKDFDRAKATLSKLKIAHLEQKSCALLSGGELQMVLFARALVSEPKLIVLDEPESNLDFANQKIILETLKSLNQEGVSIIFNTHFPAHALYHSHKVLLLQKLDSSKQGNGLFGRADKILTPENLSQIYGVQIEFIDSSHHDEFVVCV